MSINLPEFTSFDVTIEPTSLGITWSKWLKRLENLFTAIEVTDDGRKKALLLHYAGEDVNEIYETLVDATGTFSSAKEALTTYFKPKKNLTFQVYNFRNIKQDDSGKKSVHAEETIDQYVARLKLVAARCEFHDVDREIRDQIVFNCKSDILRRKALRDDSSLPDLLKLARSMELSESQARTIETSRVCPEARPEIEINKLAKKPGKYSKKSINKKEFKNDKLHDKKCFACGNSWPHVGSICPAKG